MPQIVKQTCWSCGATETYDCLSVHFPSGWAETLIAGSVQDFCSICSSQKWDGKWSDRVLQNIKQRHGIQLDHFGNVAK